MTSTAVASKAPVVITNVLVAACVVGAVIGLFSYEGFKSQVSSLRREGLKLQQHNADLLQQNQKLQSDNKQVCASIDQSWTVVSNPSHPHHTSISADLLSSLRLAKSWCDKTA